MPSPGRSRVVLGVSEVFDTISDDLLLDGKHSVLECFVRLLFLLVMDRRIHCSIGNEICHCEDLTRVRIHECFIPCSSFLVLDLDHMDEGSRTIGSGKILETGLPAIVFSVQSFLGLSND